MTYCEENHLIIYNDFLLNTNFKLTTDTTDIESFYFLYWFWTCCRKCNFLYKL